MPTKDRSRVLGRDDVHRVVEAAGSGIAGRRGLGLEVELFPLVDGAVSRRSPIRGEGGTITPLAVAPRVQACLDAGETVTESGWRCRGDRSGRVSFEPGGQLEVSTHYRPDPAQAVAAAEALTTMLTDGLTGAGIQLAAAGIDLWDPGRSPQQLSGPRYPAMARALSARGSAGATMMRDTCALQLNLDLDTGAEAAARWQVLNLLAPVATATFACSPSWDGAVRSRRSLTWQAVDATRTGFVHDPARHGAEIADELERFALDADVLFVAAEAGTVPMQPGWRFRDWMRHGHPRLGWPTERDFAIHLTNLFPEVRVRGSVEVRSVDAVPARWRRAVVALYLGAVYDVPARDRILDVLTARSTPLAPQLRAAATVGLSDPAWCALAVEVWSFALEGASRLPAGALDSGDVQVAAAFLDHFTLRGRCPADDLLAALHHGPSAALAWATEPGTARQEVTR